MREVADFLRNRWAEARAAELAKRRSIPSAFDGHDVEVRYERDMPAEVLIDGHPYAAEKYLAVATEPAPDPHAIADLDAKLALVDELDAADPHGGYITGTFTAYDALKLLAQPFAGHPDHKGEGWAP